VLAGGHSLRYRARMRKTGFVAVLLAGALVASSACDKGSRPAPTGTEAPQGLPAGGSGAVNAPGAPTGQGEPPNPHAGIDMGGGMQNPHGDMANPHAGGGGMEGNMPAPGPLDPNSVIEGTIDVAPALAGKVKPGDVIFLSLKAVDPTTGELRRPPGFPALQPEADDPRRQDRRPGGGDRAHRSRRRRHDPHRR
jgi:hypothetical protein